MDWTVLYPMIRSLWTVWFLLLFVGIVLWALWPSRRATLEDHGRIPLRIDE